jgi:hypothetical protein
MSRSPLITKRTLVAIVGTAALWSLGFFKEADVASAIAAISIAIAGAAAGEAFAAKKHEVPKDEK